MPRLPRSATGDIGVFHVYNRSGYKKTIFHDDDDRRYFLQLLEENIQKYSVEIYHYVLMPNHYHLVLRSSVGTELSDLMKRIGYRYSVMHKAKYGGYGRLWQNRFRARLIRSDSDLLTCGLYVENNPVKSGLCRRAEEYPWSSHRAYLIGDGFGFLKPSPTYLSLGDVRGRKSAYRALANRWVDDGLTDDHRLDTDLGMVYKYDVR